MVENDFKDLEYGQIIYYKNDIVTIRIKRECVFGWQVSFDGFSFLKWYDICSECSLTPPKEKKKYHLYWIKLSDSGYFYKSNTPVDEDGRRTDGSLFGEDFYNIEKIKCENDWLEV